MIFNYKDCIEHYGTDYKIKQALAEKTLFQKEKGLYSDKEFCSELELIVAKYPRAVFTGESAFYYYGFTDVIPTHYFMATRREDTRIKDKRVEQAFVKDSLYDFDKVTIEYQNVEISIYSRERLLVDLIRFKSKVPLSRSYLNILINELKHNEHNDVIHNILLLYNIAYLQADAYFDFDKYQNICWNLEDINATADKELHFSNLDEAKNPRKQWLEEILALHIDHGAFASLKKEAQQALDRRSYLYKDDPAFKLEENSLYLKVIHYFCGKKIEEWGSSLGNLTLLDENTNKHYHNDLFPCKREKILKRVQRGFFIPPCTLKVFMKSFDGMGNTLMWTKEDAEIYKKDILDTISVYLEIPA